MIRIASGFDFGNALQAAKKGLRIRLPHWEERAYVRVERRENNCFDRKSIEPFLIFETEFAIVPWTPTHMEMLSERWEIEIVLEA